MKSFTQTVRAELFRAKGEKKRMEQTRAFVRDCFLIGGVISNPTRTYHLEFSLDDANAEKLTKILTDFQLRPKKIARGGQSVVYLKEAEEIADVLKIIRADKSLLALEELRVQKSIANDVNRRINFETANLSKTVDAALIQTEAIKFISETVGLGYLSAPLKEVARLRLEHEDKSLTEIGQLLDPPVGKSGVNHRLRKICKIAESLAKPLVT